MKKQNFFQKVLCPTFLFGLFFVATYCFFCPHSALAADRPDYRLQVSPLQLGIGDLKPGVTYKGELEVQNTGAKAYDYSVEVAPFSVSGADYVQDFENGNKYTEIKDWVSIVEGATGRVEPGSREKVKYTITVPEDAPAGNQSAALIVTMIDDIKQEGTGVQTKSRIASYFYANIEGETRAVGQVLENNIPGFIFNPPIVASSKVKNDGNIYTYAQYILEVREFFGNKLAYTNITQDKNGDEVYETHVIFPETERYAEVSWDGAPQLGLFKVRQTIRIFDQESFQEKVVFLCPIWFLVIVLIFVAVAIFWLVSRLGKKKHDA